MASLDVGFKLAPRFNAAGRMGCGRLVVELLTAAGPDEAPALAQHLDHQNRLRQRLEREILASAVRQAERHLDDAGLVLASPDWHPGVIGIVASRLVERYHRPVVLLATAGAVGQGSGRSVPGVALHEALAACGRLLVSHGGHAAAAGCKVRPADIPAFREELAALCAEK